MTLLKDILVVLIYCHWYSKLLKIVWVLCCMAYKAKESWTQFLPLVVVRLRLICFMQMTSYNFIWVALKLQKVCQNCFLFMGTLSINRRIIINLLLILALWILIICRKLFLKNLRCIVFFYLGFLYFQGKSRENNLHPIADKIF